MSLKEINPLRIQLLTALHKTTTQQSSKLFLNKYDTYYP